MADDVTFDGVCFAIGAQAALGDPNTDIYGVAGTIDESHGCVLGIRDAGDAESGVTLPTLARVGSEKAPAGYTQQPTTRFRTDVTGLSIAIEMKGNGDTTSTPAGLGEAKPLAGTDGDECVHALWLSAGFSGANGAAPTYVYTPASDPTYATIKLFVGDQAWIFEDCLSNVTIDLTPGGIGIATFSFEVGSLYSQSDGLAFPDVTYGSQTDQSAPVVQGASTHVWNQNRGFNTYSLSVNNNLERIPDSNQATGERVILASRGITLSSTMWIDSDDSDFEYEELIRETITATTGTVQVGTAAGDGALVNAYKIEMETPEVTSIKYNRLGSALVVETEQKAVGASSGSEFTLTFN